MPSSRQTPPFAPNRPRSRQTAPVRAKSPPFAPNALVSNQNPFRAKRLFRAKRFMCARFERRFDRDEPRSRHRRSVRAPCAIAK
eukprot:5029120-Pleurochrysis_carterae.AAC.1